MDYISEGTNIKQSDWVTAPIIRNYYKIEFISQKNTFKPVGWKELLDLLEYREHFIILSDRTLMKCFNVPGRSIKCVDKVTGCSVAILF